MAPDRITVDDPLISTDVDSLIRTIADKKRVALNELRDSCKIDRRTMDNWISVLEEEGYISVEYGIRGTFIVWKGLDEMAPAEVEPKSESIPPEDDMPTVDNPPEPSADQSTMTDDTPIPANDQPVIEESPPEDLPPAQDEPKEPEPEELLSEYLDRKKESGALDLDDIRESILTNLEDEKETSEKIPEDEVAKTPESKEPEPEVISPEVEEDSEEDEPDDAGQPEIREFHTIKPEVQAADVRALMGSYMEEINREKANIETLKKEREALYREKFATMEGKMQADLVVLSEKIVEKQSKVAELKERVLALPDRVEELSRLQGLMDKLRKEGREALERTKKRTDDFIGSIQTSKAEIEAKIGQVDASVAQQTARTKELEKISTGLGARSEKIRTVIDATKTQIDELNSAMSSLAADLQQVEQMKSEINAMTDSIKETVASHGEELESLEKELEGIEQVEHWVNEYVRDYEEKIEDIEQYVSSSEDELADLRGAAESLYMREYLGELESLTEGYENELYDAVTREKEIEQKLAQSRSRVTELVKESQDMIKKLRTDVSGAKEYPKILANVKEKLSRAKGVVSEKQKERSKLAEDSKTTRKTKSVAPKKSTGNVQSKKKRK